jgi:protein TonB
VSSSASDAAALPPAPFSPLSGRLAGALAASIVLHAWAAAVLDGLPRGTQRGEPALLEAGPPKPLRVALRSAEPGPRPEAPAAEATAAAPRAAAAQAGAGSTEQPGLSLPDPRYYTTKELDVRPGILVRVEPEYPEAAARQFLSGRVVARLLINPAGVVEKVEIVGAEPPGFFEASAEKAFLAARFTPGMKGGRAVYVQLLLEVSFDSAPPPKPTGA